jgi:hypothetical protein
MANRIYTPKSNNTQGSPPKPMHSVHDEHDTSPDTAKRSPAVSAVQDVGSREATELEQLPITASGESVNVASPDLVGAHASAGNTKTQDEPSWKVSAAVSRFWKRQISIHVPHEACRDHWGGHFLLQCDMSPQSCSVALVLLFSISNHAPIYLLTTS